MLSVPVVTPITFESQPGETYFVAQDAARALGWSFTYDPVTEIARVGNHTVDPALPRLWDKSYLVPISLLRRWGAAPTPRGLRSGSHLLTIVKGNKRVVVHLRQQTMSAFEGPREVIRCAVSSGRPGKETPTGRFHLGVKDAHHVSSIYGSPMPWAVHVVGGIYVHGSEWFSDTPASHGCIRLEMHGDVNWAKWFFDWAKSGTPISVDMQ